MIVNVWLRTTLRVAQRTGTGSERTVSLQVTRMIIGKQHPVEPCIVIGHDGGEDWGDTLLIRTWPGVLMPGEIAISASTVPHDETRRLMVAASIQRKRAASWQWG